MKSLNPGDESPVGPSGKIQTSERNDDEQSAVVGNERMTALASAVLLVLILVELVSAAILRTLLSIHVFAGVLLVGPLVVKLGSTFWRFLRYYTGSPAFVRRGPPRQRYGWPSPRAGSPSSRAQPGSARGAPHRPARSSVRCRPPRTDHQRSLHPCGSVPMCARGCRHPPPAQSEMYQGS